MGLATQDEKIKALEEFRGLLQQWSVARRQRHSTGLDALAIRSQINQTKPVIRQMVIEQGCMKIVTIAPPPAVGGLVMRNMDPFDLIFDPPYRQDMLSVIVDMLDETIGLIRVEPSSPLQAESSNAPTVSVEIVKNFAFVAMPMNPDDHHLGDVLDAIKEAAQRCDVQAERVDDQMSNDRITDRILESIRKAEFVIADLSNARPNVYFEAGYAHALGKTPIYIASAGTKLEFDLKDYPVIFFKNLRELKQELERRLRAIAAEENAG